MKEYGELFHEGRAWADRARAFSEKVRDVSEALVELGRRAPGVIRSPRASCTTMRCHLAHAQGVRAQPRALLAAIPGIELLSPAEAEICCGSAGIYNLVQPEPASQLGERKARNIAALAPTSSRPATPGASCRLPRRPAARARLDHRSSDRAPRRSIKGSVRCRTDPQSVSENAKKVARASLAEVRKKQLDDGCGGGGRQRRSRLLEKMDDTPVGSTVVCQERPARRRGSKRPDQGVRTC